MTDDEILAILDRRFHEWVADPSHDTITMDDVTDKGRYAFDDEHDPNAKQNKSGSFLRKRSRGGQYLIHTDRSIMSESPKRKGGRQAVWKITAAGRKNSQQWLLDNPPPKKRRIVRRYDNGQTESPT